MADAVGQWQDVPNPSAAAGQWQDVPNPAGGGGADQPSAASRLWNSFVAALPHPIDAIKEWANRPAEIRKAMDGLHEMNQLESRAASDPQNQGKPRNQWVWPEASPDQRQTIEAGMQAHLGMPEGNLLTEVSAPGVTAAKQAASGDLAGAGGTVLGGYVAPAAAAAVTPEIAARAPAAARVVGKGAAAAAPDLAVGTAKVAGGLTLGYLAGKLGLGQVVEYLAGAKPGWAGISQIGEGLKKGWQAGKDALSPEPAATPAAATPPPAPPTPAPAPASAAPSPAPGPTLADLQAAASRVLRKPATAPAAAAQPPPEAPPAAPPTPNIPPAAEPPVTAPAPAATPAKPAYDPAAAPRQVKVNTLADTLYGEIASKDAARMTPGDWNRLADALGINRPSPKTIAATLEQLADREASADLNRSSENTLAAARQKAQFVSRAADPAKVAATVEELKPKPTLASAREAAQVGQTITTKNGKTGTVTKVNPNGTIEYQ